ncbi:MAG TPA: hypothetical protein VKA96_07085, partial [Solirubrobacteraceae bacterium]|nr:hypothetical protein [Solirubrobacteraceae bacterium]
MTDDIGPREVGRRANSSAGPCPRLTIEFGGVVAHLSRDALEVPAVGRAQDQVGAPKPGHPGR